MTSLYQRNQQRGRATSGWLAGLLLGALAGLTTISFALGILGMPIVLASIALIAWKGPQAIAGAGFLTGWGLLWTVAILNSTISCLTIDRGPGRWCEPGEGVGPFLVAGIALFAGGLLASAFALRRERRH
jgi:hypothetical protein